MKSFDKLDKIMMKREIKNVKRMRKGFVEGLRKENNEDTKVIDKNKKDNMNFLIIPDGETISSNLIRHSVIMGSRSFKNDPILEYRLTRNEVINGNIKGYINDIHVKVELDINNITISGPILSVIKEIIYENNVMYKQLKKLKKKYKKLKMKKEKHDDI